jgi:hypothetical protein
LNKKKVDTFKYSKYEKNVMVGIDPGAKTLVTAVALVDQSKLDKNNDKFLPLNDKNRKRINKISIKCDKSVESALKLADPDKNFATLVFSYSGSQYYHETKVNEKNRIAAVYLNASQRIFKNVDDKSKQLEEIQSKIDEINNYNNEPFDPYVFSLNRKKLKRYMLKLNNQKQAIFIYDILFKHGLTKQQMKEKKFESIKIIMNKINYEISNKTSEMDNYNEYLKYKKKHEDVLLKYSEVNSSRKWELTSSIEKQKVFEKIHSAIKDCTVGYGNYSQAASSIIKVKSNFILLFFFILSFI